MNIRTRLHLGWLSKLGLPCLAALLILVPKAQTASTETPPVHYNLDKSHLAIDGYDPVGYLTVGKALKGRKDLVVQDHGVSYQFASAENQALFQKDPSKYKPAYGGWCATAMAKGEKVEIDPTNFKVTQGRVFLFFKAFYGNALKDWLKDEPAQTTKADANWKRIAGE